MGSIRAMAMAGRLVCLIAIALALNSGDADGAPLLNPELVEFSDISDLGESSAVAEGGEDIAAVADYKSTKTKYEGLIKKVKASLKKKKAKAKKHFDAQMKKFHTTFAKLYAPIKSGPKPTLDSPLGADGMSGMSGMARWAYSTQVAAFTKAAHRKMARYETLLQENYYRHFSTAVCKEVLQKKVPAIGDLEWKRKNKKIKGMLKAQKASLNQKVAFDRADMQHKIASFKVWNKNAEFAVNGGAGYEPNKKKTKMMSSGQDAKLQNGKYGELVHAAHWAFAKQKAHAIEFYDRNVEKLKKRLKKVRTQHDLTLCRTGRKPNSPMLKFQLKRAKSKLKKQLTKMPAKAQKKAAKKKLKKKLKKAKKAKKKAKKAKKKKGEEVGDENDLGESMEDETSNDTENTNIVEFRKLVDASGSDETISERAQMFKDLVGAADLEKQGIEEFMP